MSRPSVVCLSVCLSSVTFVRPAHRVKLFVNIFATPETWTVCFKIFLQKIVGVLGDRAS